MYVRIRGYWTHYDRVIKRSSIISHHNTGCPSSMEPTTYPSTEFVHTSRPVIFVWNLVQLKCVRLCVFLLCRGDIAAGVGIGYYVSDVSPIRGALFCVSCVHFRLTQYQCALCVCVLLHVMEV